MTFPTHSLFRTFLWMSDFSVQILPRDFRLTVPLSPGFISGQHWLCKEFLQRFPGVFFSFLLVVCFVGFFFLWMSKMQHRLLRLCFKGTQTTCKQNWNVLHREMGSAVHLNTQT